MQENETQGRNKCVLASYEFLSRFCHLSSFKFQWKSATLLFQPQLWKQCFERCMLVYWKTLCLQITISALFDQET